VLQTSLQLPAQEIASYMSIWLPKLSLHSPEPQLQYQYNPKFNLLIDASQLILIEPGGKGGCQPLGETTISTPASLEGKEKLLA
jgi:hypothetical protein